MFTVKDGLRRKEKDPSRSNRECFSPLLFSDLCTREQLELLFNENHTLSSLKHLVGQIELGNTPDPSFYFDLQGEVRRRFLEWIF